MIGGSGYTGAELLRILSGHPEIEVVHVTADSNAGAAVGDAVSVAGAAYPGLDFAAYEAGPLAGLDVVFVALPARRVTTDRAGARRARSATWSTSAPTSGSPPRCPPWYGAAHGAPDLLEQFATGCPSCSPTSPARHVAAPGCYPTAAALVLAPLLAAGWWSRSGWSSTRCRACRGGPGLSAPSLYSEANETVSAYGCSRTATRARSSTRWRVAGSRWRCCSRRTSSR